MSIRLFPYNQQQNIIEQGQPNRTLGTIMGLDPHLTANHGPREPIDFLKFRFCDQNAMRFNQVLRKRDGQTGCRSSESRAKPGS